MYTAKSLQPNNTSLEQTLIEPVIGLSQTMEPTYLIFDLYVKIVVTVQIIKSQFYSFKACTMVKGVTSNNDNKMYKFCDSFFKLITTGGSRCKVYNG